MWRDWGSGYRVVYRVRVEGVWYRSHGLRCRV